MHGFDGKDEWAHMGKRRGLPSGAALAVVGVSLAAGCATDDEGPAADPLPPGEVSATSATGGPVRLGQAIEWTGARTTVTAVRRLLPPGGGGTDALGVRAETCASAEAVEVGWYQFAAHGPASERYPAPGAGDRSGPRPSYPQGAVEPGTCVEGWLVIPVAAGAPVSTVRLSDPDGIPLGEWRLPPGSRG